MSPLTKGGKQENSPTTRRFDPPHLRVINLLFLEGQCSYTNMWGELRRSQIVLGVVFGDRDVMLSHELQSRGAQTMKCKTVNRNHWNFGGEKCLIHGLHFTV